MSLLNKFFKKKHSTTEVETELPILQDDQPFDEELDCKKMICPRPIFEISKKIKEMSSQSILRITCTDPAFENDIKAWCSRTANKLQKIKKSNNYTIAYILKS